MRETIYQLLTSMSPLSEHEFIEVASRIRYKLDIEFNPEETSRDVIAAQTASVLDNERNTGMLKDEPFWSISYLEKVQRGRVRWLIFFYPSVPGRTRVPTNGFSLP